VEYRIAKPADAELIAQVHAESWRRTLRGMFLDEFLDGDLVANRRAVWREWLGRPRGDQFVCVAVAEVRIAGFICAYGAEDPEWGSLIDNLHVAREHQRGGIGSALMRHAAVWLVSSYGDCGVYLWVMEANQAARRFYQGLGSANAGTVEKENPGGGTARSCRYVWSRPDLLARVGSTNP
jgi:ribosomal protein S18 acetylase RimI-like enzyme